jgi:hypothetical protein
MLMKLIDPNYFKLCVWPSLMGMPSSPSLDDKLILMFWLWWFLPTLDWRRRLGTGNFWGRHKK